MRERGIATALLLLLGACGDESLDRERATQAMGDVVDAASRAWTNISAGLATVDGAWVSGNASGFSLSGALQGTQGGSATVSGSGSKQGTTYSFELELDFKGWKGTSGLALNGTLKAAFEVTNLVGSIMTVEYSGEIDVDGTTAGFDVTVTFSGPGQYSICGTVGGADVSTAGC